MGQNRDMAKEARFTIRIDGELAAMFLASCEKARLDPPNVWRAFAEAFNEEVNEKGGIFMPFRVLPKPATAKPPAVSIGSTPTPARTPASKPRRGVAGYLESKGYIDPSSKPSPGSASESTHGTNEEPPTKPRVISRTRRAIQKMTAREAASSRGSKK